jgi:DNA-binding MarR family transcriptional regulator
MKHSSIDVPEDSNGFLLWSVSKLWQQSRQKSLKEIGLSHVEFVLLGHLFWLTTKHNYVTQQMLSDWIHVDKVSVATKIPLLEKKGLVQKKPHPKDKRASYLTVTDKGAEIAKKGLKNAKQINEEFFAPLGNKQEELTQLLKILLKAHKEVKL